MRSLMMRKKIAVLLLSLLYCTLCFLLCGCSASERIEGKASPSPTEKAAFQMISAEQAKALMQSLADEGKSYVLLDVRTAEEYAEKRIEGAILIPIEPADEIKARASEELPDKSAVILVYCRSGRRSKLAAEELCAMGYTHVYEFGGINDWPYDTVSGD